MSKIERPTRSDGDQTRLNILEAAGRLIALRGFADTPNKTIAEAAGVDQASINYHFGNRNGLYKATLIEAHRRVIKLERLKQILASNSVPKEQIKLLVEELVDAIYVENGWHAVVFAREVLSPSANLQMVMAEEVFPKIAVVQQLICQYTGIPQGHPMLVQCLISVAAPCLMLMIAGRGMPGPVKEVLGMPKQNLVEHLHSFSVAGLDARAESYLAGQPGSV